MKQRVDTLRDAHDRIDALESEASRRQLGFAHARAAIRARIDHAVRRRGALFGMFIGGLVFGMLPTPPLRRVRAGVNRLPGGLMSIAVIALRMQAAFNRVAHTSVARTRVARSEPDDHAEGSVGPASLPRANDY